MPIEPLVFATSFCSTIGAIIIATSWERLTTKQHRHKGSRRCRRPKWLPRKFRNAPVKSVPRSYSSYPEQVVSEHVYGPDHAPAWRESRMSLPEDPELTYSEWQSTHQRVRPTIKLHRARSASGLLSTIPEESIQPRSRTFSVSTITSLPQDDGAKDKPKDRIQPLPPTLDPESYEGFAEQLRGIERMIMQDRIDALRKSVLQNRLLEVEDDMDTLGYGISASRAPLRRVASVGPSLASSETCSKKSEDVLRDLRQAEAMLPIPSGLHLGNISAYRPPAHGHLGQPRSYSSHGKAKVEDELP